MGTNEDRIWQIAAARVATGEDLKTAFARAAHQVSLLLRDLPDGYDVADDKGVIHVQYGDDGVINVEGRERTQVDPRT